MRHETEILTGQPVRTRYIRGMIGVELVQEVLREVESARAQESGPSTHSETHEVHSLSGTALLAALLAADFNVHEAITRLADGH